MNSEIEHMSTSKMSSDQVSCDAGHQSDSQICSVSIDAMYEIVQAVMKKTNFNHEISKVAVETVLISLRKFLPSGAARSIINTLLIEANGNMPCHKNAVNAEPDALRMVTALDSLFKATNDTNGMVVPVLRGDAYDVQTRFFELISVMSNGELNIWQSVLCSDNYTYVTGLVSYYQMETRWPLRQLLLQVFAVMCGSQRTVLKALALSALPGELARDMREYRRSASKLSYSALLLSMVLSMGDKLPITHFEQLGGDFAEFLLELVEDPPASDVDEQIPELFVTILLAYNLQFDDTNDNLLLNALETRDNAINFYGKITRLLNCEEDPVRIFDHVPAPPHAVWKLVVDLSSRKTTAERFYINNLNVVINIIVLQLPNLSPGDKRLQQYLQVLQGIIHNTEYIAHMYHRDELLRFFNRIICADLKSHRNDQALDILPYGPASFIIDALMRGASSNMRYPKTDLSEGLDALRMITALNLLFKANDAQQKGWTIFDDDNDIQTQLLELISVMFSAKVQNPQCILSSHNYTYVSALVSYYQIETRWRIKNLLLQAFGIMCDLDRTVLATLALSALPTDLARDMRDNSCDVSRLSHPALLLSMVLSMGDRWPVAHFEQLGGDFAEFLLELVEDPPASDVDEQIPELFVTILLAYNLQFDDTNDNLLLNALETRDNATSFCERIFYLFYVGEDPVRMFDHVPAPPHSVVKLVVDLSSRKKTANHFYTTNLNLTLDIIITQLRDACNDNMRRQQYLKILHGIFRNTDYGAQTYRRDDILRCFFQIVCEESDSSREDQVLIRVISSEFPQYFK